MVHQGPTMVRKWSQNGPTSPKKGPHMVQKWSRNGSKMVQMVQVWTIWDHATAFWDHLLTISHFWLFSTSSGGPNWSKHGSPWSQNGPRSPSMLRKWSQNGPSMIPKWSQIVQTWSTMLPKWVPEWSRMLRSGPKKAQHGRKWSKMVEQWPKHGRKIAPTCPKLVPTWSKHGRKFSKIL